MSLYKYPGSSRQTAPPPVGITEFEILKASHKFLRDEDEKPSTWDEQLAGKYYSNLYREFAVCDLKHYKSGNFALRWRTEEEVLDGSGETTCGNTRCTHHFPPRFPKENSKTPLTTLELPFTYQEQDEVKSALVKVVLCGKCVKKLMWKRSQEKGKGTGREGEGEKEEEREEEVQGKGEEGGDGTGGLEKRRRKKRSRSEADEAEEEEKSSRRRKESPSKSPRRPSAKDVAPGKEKSSSRT